MPIKTFTRPAVDIDALQWLPDASNTIEVLTNFFADIVAYDANSSGVPYIVVRTPEGNRNVVPGWWFLAAPAGTLVEPPAAFTVDFTEKGVVTLPDPAPDVVVP